jgi:putative endonuclease
MSEPGPEWYVYMVRCRDGSLYTGVATDVNRRLSEHRQALTRAARYVKGRGPLTLVLRHKAGSRSLALRVEHEIKKLTRPQKEALVEFQELVEALL